MKGAGEQGPALAGLILLLWLGSLAAVLLLDPIHLTPPWWVAAVLLRTWLHTGLFIVAHDAMHGLLLPGRPRANHRMGTLALALYGALDYGHCRRNHALHHHRPASAGDPDFLRDPGDGALRWYLQFMVGYLTWKQMTLLLAGWGGLIAGLGLIQPISLQQASLRMLMGCTLPLLLSSMQLFVVGTYLPHRRHSSDGPTSLAWPGLLSLLACYHFGYHREHHEQPDLAWFELPEAHRRNRLLALP